MPTIFISQGNRTIVFRHFELLPALRRNLAETSGLPTGSIGGYEDEKPFQVRVLFYPLNGVLPPCTVKIPKDRDFKAVAVNEADIKHALQEYLKPTDDHGWAVGKIEYRRPGRAYGPFPRNQVFLSVNLPEPTKEGA